MILNVNNQTIHAATGAVPLANRSEPLVVLVHGAGMDRTVWSHQTRFLAHHGFRALAVDLPGHGRSDGPPLTSIEDLALWVAALAEYFDQPLHLVGHSMGALIALHAAGHHQESVASLGLLGVAVAMPVHPELLAAAQDNDPKAAALMASWGLGSLQHVGENPTPGLSMVGGVQALIESSPPGVLATDLAACSVYDQAVMAAENTQCPVTMFLGSGDKMTPRRAAQPLIDSFVTNPAVNEIADCGHMMMMEKPNEIRQGLLAHLGKAL
ncbi:MAG TPA: alpha/beta hydrolase [Acidimicrobiia bacterium]|jgi:pimeloyl-ACP methyl ester carboxylesterase|nr:alpha/beta hydrolase [Acidimicrobiia bacterium]HIL46882.1 alpha/beta hydrolase [Acidimicrobiia bacterium]